MPNLKRLLLTLLISGTSVFSNASNFHEHLQYLPLAQDFRAAFEDIMAGRGRTQPIQMKQFWAYTPHPENYLYDIGVGRLTDMKKVISEVDLNTLTLAELVRRLAAQTGQTEWWVFQRFLRLPQRQRLSKRQTTDIYLTAGTIRRTIIDKASIPTALEIYRSYLNRERLQDRRHLWVSLARGHFFTELQVRKIRAILELLEQRGTRVRYVLSVGRNSFLRSGVGFKSIEMRELTRTDGLRMIDGIDIVGSIVEDNTSPRRMENRLSSSEIRDRFLELFAFADRHDLETRLHVFEKKSEGRFYTGLRQAIERYPITAKRPRFRLEIGHIAFISTAWMDFFEKHQNRFEFVFNVNLRSNETLLEKSAAEISAIAQQLRQRNFTVLLGSDGRGILSRASFSAQALELQRYTNLPWLPTPSRCAHALASAM